MLNIINLISGTGLASASELKIEEQVNLTQYRHDVSVLASDQFGGRGPLSAGETLTLSYLVNAFKEMGLKPGFGDSYLQGVPLAKMTPESKMSLNVGDLRFKNGVDFTARTERMDALIKLSKSELVFVGYGINAPEYGWNDYEGIDVKGKTVIVLVNDPGFATQDPQLFKGNAMTYYGRWTYKYEEAARQGAAAALIVHETAPAAYGWGVVKNSNTGSKFTLVDENNNQDKLGVLGWLQKEAAEQIFAEAGLDYNKQKVEAAKKGFKALGLNSTVSLTLKTHIEKETSYNVLALLPGSEHAKEMVVLQAHWDHLGTVIDEKGKKHIYNGAVDNASGVAGVLELARIFKKLSLIKPFQRSILFASFTAEETGLIGAQHFSLNPPIATKNIVAFLNIDGMNVNDEVSYILRYGDGVSTLETDLALAAKSQGRTVKGDPRPENGLLYRSDHFALAQQGVPGLLFMSLGDTDPDYIAHKYHKDTDDFSQSWTLGGVKQDLGLIGSILAKLANNNDWPRWIEHSDFKKRRAEDGR
ncbi:M28 family metallopeptidase [Shewanella surugensis]|uniref:M28 family metallopeptidase n=2 Tax=Shewanella surugensis TaxID=212020 RepID=A0ABT0L900_9GAMM|nr:M28 family metallopeptidase [Shewanella surugensis]MCL1124177.1 M28 family metallopeptidase [Shewanella surugensis]